LMTQDRRMISGRVPTTVRTLSSFMVLTLSRKGAELDERECF
jgi:hypothetical protein